jgi:hypothetical protein
MMQGSLMDADQKAYVLRRQSVICVISVPSLLAERIVTLAAALDSALETRYD